MLIRKGIVIHGRYCGGEWAESERDIEATGDTMEFLEANVKQLTKENSSKGNRIDFDFISNTKHVIWESTIYEQNEYIAPGTQYKLNLLEIE